MVDADLRDLHAPIAKSPADLPKPGWYAAPRRGWAVVGLLSAAYMFSILDRQILNLLAPPIQRDLKLSDLQLSYLQGPFFVVLYVLMGPLFGWMADHLPRKRVAAIGIMIWSVATALSSQTQAYSGLAAVRLGVGAGESALCPAATSMISDLLPAEHRAKALSLFGIGPVFGAVFVLLGAPVIIPEHTIDLGWAGSLKPWQAAFLIAALPGLAIAGVLLLIREPTRRSLAAPEPERKLALLHFVASRKRAFFAMFAGSILITSVGYGANFNIPLFYSRTFGWGHYEIGKTIGLLNLVTLVPGGLAGGWLASHLRQKGRQEGTYSVMLIGCLVSAVPEILTWLMPTPEGAILLLGTANLGMGVITPLLPAVVADMAPNVYRGRLVAWLLCGIQIFGAGIAPIGVASLTEFVYGAPLIGRSLATFCLCLIPCAIAAFIYGLPAVRLLTEENSLNDVPLRLVATSE